MQTRRRQQPASDDLAPVKLNGKIVGGKKLAAHVGVSARRITRFDQDEGFLRIPCKGPADYDRRLIAYSRQEKTSASTK